MEEKDKKKKRKQQKELKQNRGRLQALNKTLPRTNTQEKKKNGSCVLSSASVSIEGPKGCLGSLLSSSSHSRQPSSSGSHYQRNPSKKSCCNKPLATKSESAPDLTRPGPKPSSLKSGKKPFFLPQWQSGKKPPSKVSQRPKLSAGLSNPLRNPAFGSERYEVNQRGQDLGEVSDFNFSFPDNLVGFEDSTPVGKLLCGSSLNYAIVDDKPPVGEDSNSANLTVKSSTPPVEASVSPEIQAGSYIAVATSTVTPVCYGAGHLISGVTDKRKCRSRGVLIVRDPTDSSGIENFSSYEDDANENADNVLFKSRNSLTPLPAEASVNWLSSPLGKEGEVQNGDSSDSSRPLALAPICIPSSPSSLCQFSSDLLNGSGDKDGDGNSDAVTSTGKTRIVLLSPRRVSICQGLLGFSSERKDLDISATPKANSSCVRLPEEGGCSYSLIGDKNPASVDQLSCSNVVQTPSSNTSSESRVCISWIDAHRNQFSPDQGTVARDFQMPSFSPKSQMSMWDHPVLSPRLANLASPSHSTDVIKLEKKLDGYASWISDSTYESLSQIRISWREGLASQTFDMDEFDCCRCLSDEENNGERSGEFQHKSLQAFGVENTDSLRNEGLMSPEFLEQEPDILMKGKEILSPVAPNICAESISTDASGLVASRDSDWTLYYKNHLFQV